MMSKSTSTGLPLPYDPEDSKIVYGYEKLQAELASDAQITLLAYTDLPDLKAAHDNGDTVSAFLHDQDLPNFWSSCGAKHGDRLNLSNYHWDERGKPATWAVVTRTIDLQGRNDDEVEKVLADSARSIVKEKLQKDVKSMSEVQETQGAPYLSQEEREVYAFWQKHPEFCVNFLYHRDQEHQQVQEGHEDPMDIDENQMGYTAPDDGPSVPGAVSTVFPLDTWADSSDCDSDLGERWPESPSESVSTDQSDHQNHLEENRNAITVDEASSRRRRSPSFSDGQAVPEHDAIIDRLSQDFKKRCQIEAIRAEE